MPDIEVLKADLLRPVVYRLEAFGSNWESLLDRSGIPPTALSRPGALIPQHSAWRFANNAARHAGDQLFNYDCVIEHMGRRNMNTIAGSSMSRSPTAFEVLKEVVEATDKLTTGTRFWYEIGDTYFWILRKSVLGPTVQDLQVELYALATFTKAISNILGRNWVPEKITLSQSRLPHKLPLAWHNADVSVQQHVTGIAIRLSDIVQTANFARLYPDEATNNSADADSIPDQIAIRLQKTVLPFVQNWDSNIRTVADSFGLSVRTFQRRLADEGMTYSDLVEEARFQQAFEALNDPGISITELALELGYRHPNHFSRAFARRVGVSPRRYRQMHFSGGSG